MPTFSVITVCYNEHKNIKRTLDSVVQQTCTDYELIVVDGGSTDGTTDIIRQYADHIAWWCSEPDGGTYNAMNKGVEHAKGEYVIFMNAGDWFYGKNVLETVKSAGLKTDVIEGYVIRSDNGKRVRDKYTDIYAHIFADTLSHQGTFVRHNLLLSHPFDEKYKIVADWKLWIEILIIERCSYAFINTNIAYNDMTGLSSDPSKVREEREQVYQELFPPHIVGLIHSYFKTNDLALVKYANYLYRYSPRAYHIVRKIAKRVVKIVDRFGRSNSTLEEIF